MMIGQLERYVLTFIADSERETVFVPTGWRQLNALEKRKLVQEIVTRNGKFTVRTRLIRICRLASYLYF